VDEIVMDMVALVQEAITKVCNVELGPADPGARLADLGVDSLAAAEVLVELEIRLGQDLPVHVLRRLDQAETVGDVAALLESAFGSPGSREQA
jgi:acyl carrier protein